MNVVLLCQCSDCGWRGELEMAETVKEMRCPACQHTSEPLDEEDYLELGSSQKSSVKVALLALGAVFVFILSMMLYFHSNQSSMVIGEPKMVQTTEDAGAVNRLEKYNLNEHTIIQQEQESGETTELGRTLQASHEERTATNILAILGMLGSFVAMCVFAWMGASKRHVCEF